MGTLVDLSLEVANGAVILEVSDKFTDPDGDALTYGASSSAPAIVSVSVSGSQVTLMPLAAGTAVVTVTATDVGGSNTSATQRLEATVANRAPEPVGSLLPVSLRVEDGPESVDVAFAFRDPDGDDLTYRATSSDTTVATVSVSGARVEVTPVSPDTVTITVTATDRNGSNTSAEQTFSVTVPKNAGPERVGTLEDKALLVTDSPLSVEVSGAFRDPDRDTLTYGASSSNETVATVTVSGSRVQVTPELAGTTTITVTATDVGGSNTPVSQTFDVTVGGNRSPEAVGTLRALSLRVADGAESVEVSGAFRDRDNDDLTYRASSLDTAVATVSVSGLQVEVTPAARGTATVTVTATDAAGSNTSATQRFEVTVANRAPEAGTLPPVSLRVEEGPQSVQVGLAFRDPDDDDLTYGASSSDPSLATASATGSTVRVTPLSGGTAQITVTATDTGGLRVTQTFAAEVANRGPVTVGRLPALSVRVSAGMRSVNLSGAFDDPDRDALAYEASSSATSVATVEVSGSAVRVTPLASGTTRVTATARDGGGLAAEQAFEVTVENRSPVALGSLPGLTLESGTSAVPVEVSGAFEDPDDDVLTYGATTSAVTVAAVTVADSTVTVTPLSGGSATVTVTATDVDGSNTSATQTFGVSVDGGGGGGGGGGGRNRGPAAVETLEDRTLEVGEALSLDLAQVFRDADGDELTYAAGSSAADVATVAVAGSAVTVTPLSAGEAAVTVTATDEAGSNRSATQSFTVTVAYDTDVDGLIGVHTLVQLDAVRHDLDGDGVPTAAGAAAYAAAFGLTGSGRLPCPGGCGGYELGSDLDFDTNGSGGPDAGDAYWYEGAGWLPLGTLPAPFEASFEGNGRRIRGLFVRRGDGVGLFGATGAGAVVRHVGVVEADVAGTNGVGGAGGSERCEGDGRSCDGSSVGRRGGGRPGGREPRGRRRQLRGGAGHRGDVGGRPGRVQRRRSVGRVCDGPSIGDTAGGWNGDGTAGRPVAFRDRGAVSGTVAGCGRRRAGKLARGGSSASGRPHGDRGTGSRSGAGGAGVDRGRRQRVDAVAGGELHGLPRNRRGGGDGGGRRPRLGVPRPRYAFGRRLQVPGGCGGRRRRGSTQCTGDRRGAVRACGDAAAPRRLVAGRHGRGQGDDGTELRVDGGERVGIPDGGERNGGHGLGNRDLRGEAERRRSTDGRAAGGRSASEGVPGVADRLHGRSDRARRDAGQGAPRPGTAGADRRAAHERGPAPVRVDGPDSDS